MNAHNEVGRDFGSSFRALASQAVPVRVWRNAFTEPCGQFLAELADCYGSDSARLDRRRALWLSALERFCAAFGEGGEVFLVGVPSRINWEGHHVDHQGGYYNATTDEREIVAVVRARTDPTVTIVNVAADTFPEVTFSMDGAPPKTGKDQWDGFVRGTLVALQKRFTGCRLRGMDMAIGSDIPVGAGLSSSHALVLASALGALAVNGKVLDKRQAVVLVQEGEWFVGSRTGLGDQATMVFGKRNAIFSSSVIDPDEITPSYVPLPGDHAFVLVNSFTQHKLAGEDGLAYNGRVFAYKIAYPLVVNALGELGAPREALASTRRLADINPARFATAMIYRALAALPERMTLTETREYFERALNRLEHWGASIPKSSFDELLQTYFSEGARPQAISVKGVALYGIAECWRSRRYPELLGSGDLEAAGRLVAIGHDGDRVMRRDGIGGYRAVDNQVTDRYLLALADDLESGEHARREAAAIERQSGDYRASVLELDQIVDLCRDVGAVSASLTGGGLGGVVTAMIASDRLPGLKARVLEHYAALEAQEIRQLERAQSAGAISENALRAAIDLHETKRQAHRSDRPWVADPNLLPRLEPARTLRTAAGQPVIRLLPLDYLRDGLVENASVAGAGYLSAPRG
jgi:galactokinase